MGYRYIGTKTKLLNELLAKISSLVHEGAHIIDLMCGTATVSLALAQKAYRVTAVDVMTYSYHHARIALLFSDYPQFLGASQFIKKFAGTNASYPTMLQALSNVPARKAYFWHEFSLEGSPKNAEKSRNYFSAENAKKIDAMRYWIKKLKNEGKITDLEHSLLLHDLILAANDIANIAGTYGHHLAKLTGRARDPISLKLSNIRVNDANKSNQALKGYAEVIAPSLKGDLCYIDPPYMKRQYAANYHILETLAREDSPEAIGKSGLRPWRDQYSNFCTKTKIRDSFRMILSAVQCPNFLISYSEDGLLRINELENLLSEFGVVKIETIKYKRYKSNGSKLAPKLNEYIIHLKKTVIPQNTGLVHIADVKSRHAAHH